MLLVFETTP